MTVLLLPSEIALAAVMAVVMFYAIHLLKAKENQALAVYVAGMMFLMNLLGYSLVNRFLVLPVVIANAAFMSFGILPALAGRKLGWNLTRAAFAVLMLAGEAAMGAFISSLGSGIPAGLIQSLDNPWFSYVMVSEMAFASLYSPGGVGKRSIPESRVMLFTLLAAMAFMPTVFQDSPAYVEFATWASAVAMIAATVMIYEVLYRQRIRNVQDTAISLQIMIAFTVMMIGQFLYLIYGTWVPFDAALSAVMLWYVFISLDPDRAGKNTNYLKDQRWAFSFLSLTFVMEWFMGAVLSISSGYFGSGVPGFEGSLPIGWQSGRIYAPAADLFIVIISVTGSPWFLIMMGAEMGMLAVFKFAESHNRENRVRIALMISAFFIYSIYVPFFSPIIPRLRFIPYMWTMGIGSLGPVTSSVLFTGIIGTYLVSAVLSILFGSRQLCSVTCTAPMMYQGTFYDSLKRYNRTSSMGRKTLTSRIRPWFRATVLLTSLFVFGSAVISYMNSEGFISFTVLGTDLSALVYMTWFDFLWYVVFVSIPFMGSYACVNQGWCYWGTFNQAVSYLGFFRLKVRDPVTCVNCRTVDCALACPVGLTDMRASFIEKGSFKAFKCVGVGDCVEACPYDNIYMHDVRHAVKSLFNKAE